MRGLSFPISIPQLAPVAMMLILAAFIFTQTVSADGSISGMYKTSFALAEQTYKQGADIFDGQSSEPQKSNQEPIQGTYVNQEGK